MKLERIMEVEVYQQEPRQTASCSFVCLSWSWANFWKGGPHNSVEWSIVFSYFQR